VGAVKRILVAVDLSDLTPAVVEQATRLACDASTGLCLLHVGPPAADFLGQQIYRKVVAAEVPEGLRESHAKLVLLEEQVRERGVDVESLFVRGKAIESILEEARRMDAEMIVIGSHRTGGLYRLLGSISEGVLRGATCPVLVVPAPRRDQGGSGKA
jgi:nucleotide-binding universal stress UspA family protein